jgi:hypothetical protein
MSVRKRLDSRRLYEPRKWLGVFKARNLSLGCCVFAASTNFRAIEGICQERPTRCKGRSRHLFSFLALKCGDVTINVITIGTMAISSSEM